MDNYSSFEYYKNLLDFLDDDWSSDSDVLPDVRDVIEGDDSVDVDALQKLDISLFANKKVFLKYVGYLKRGLSPACINKDIWYAKLVEISTGDYPLEKIPEYLQDSVKEFYEK